MTAISPNHTSEDFPNGMILENKIDVFASRIYGWQLNIARELIERPIPHSDYAKLHIVISSVEMLGKYLEGYIDRYESRVHFVRGMQYIYGNLSHAQEEFAEEIYTHIRNGLYHVGTTGTNVFLDNHADFGGAFTYFDRPGHIVVSPNKFVEDLYTAFTRYIDSLRHERNGDLRRNFEARFDYDNGL